MQQALKAQNQETGDKAALYPRQARPAGMEKTKAKPKTSVGLFDLLKSDSENGQPKTGAGAAFAAFNAVQKAAANDRRPTATPADFLSHWQTFAVAKKAEQESMTRRMDAVLKNVNMQGFKQVSMATTWRIKLLWIGLILLLFAIMIFEIVQCIRAYQNSPVATTYSLQTPDALEFPQVYLCYGSSFNRTYVNLHKDQVAIATAYRSRSAVTKGGQNRRKRDLSQIFNHDDNNIITLSDDDITRILAQSSDQPEDEEGVAEYDSDKWWVNGPHPQGEQAQDDGWVEWGEEDDAYERIPSRMKRDITDPTGNNTMNATMLAQKKAMEEQMRIDAMMDAANISDVVYDYFHDAGFKLEETFLECEFHSYTRQPLDCKEIVKPIMDANYGMCYLVTMPEDIKQTVAGQGLRLLMNSHVNLYPQYNEGAPKYAGVLISVNKAYDPFNWLKSLAAPGQLTKIDLDASYVELLNLESGNLIQPCVEDDMAQSMLRIFKGTYSRTMCQMDCLYQAHMNACQCVYAIERSQLKDEIMNDTTFCGPKQVKECLANSADAVDKAVNACRAHCHNPCKSYRYEMRSSYAQLNARAFAHVPLPTNVTAKQLIELRVAYSRKEIATLIQSPSASFADMVSNLGGQINLWMGASMISLLQMAFMAIGFVFWRIYMKVHKLNKGGAK